MTDQDLLYSIALTFVKGVGDITARQLIEHTGEAGYFFREKPSVLQKIPGITPRLCREIKDAAVLKRAEEEIRFIRKNSIYPVFITEEEYPVRMKELVDAPVLLYAKGKFSLNADKVISIVGTREATSYGRDFTRQFIRDMAVAFPDILVVSGLAYGIDIIAHQAALKEGVSTVGVLAHGLDRIYPFRHREIALEMQENGGLLTDFPGGTNPDRQNFVKRNRIVAGLSDCTLIVESAERGGALITANIAFSYNKDVFAVPGKSTDIFSRGCNKLIREKKASLIENAAGLIQDMGWVENEKKVSASAVQYPLPFDLSPEEKIIAEMLSASDGLHLNTMAVRLDIPVSRLSVLLFEMEMKGLVKCLPGGIYRY